MSEPIHTGHKYSLTTFLLLANGITWLCWIPGIVIGAQRGYLMPNFDTLAALIESGFANSEHVFLAIAFQVGTYGPLVGGLVATYLDSGRKGLTDLWKRITRWNIGGRWYLTVLAIAFLLTGIPVGLFALTDFTPGPIAFSFVLFLFVVQVFTSGIGEEPGWRGFLLPQLKARFAGETYVWVLGFVWAIWHYPVTIFYVLPTIQGLALPQTVIMLLLSLAGQTMSLIGMAFIYAWLYSRTQSLLLMIVFHALSNVFSYWLISFLADPKVLGVLPMLMPWMVVIFMQKRMGKEHFPG